MAVLNNEEDLITWSNTLSCGVKLIDDQHKELVRLVNEMFHHVTGDQTQEQDFFNRVIGETVKYIKVHFATEERIMIATKYAGYDDHKKEHETFVLKTVENIKDYQEGKRLTLSSFTKFIKDWILSHIAVMDKQYFEHFKKLASRKADGRLSINSDDVAIFS
jgi:hemerythrin